MKALLSSFAAGLLFSIGLGVAGMTQADKVIGFLNVAGDWDPSLGLVMAGAIGVHLTVYRLLPKMKRPLFEGRFRVPTRADIDARLVGGAALFGIGWALGGYCPGPGLVAGASGSTTGLLFLVGMVTGMTLFSAVDDARAILPARAPSSPSDRVPNGTTP